MKNDMRVLLTVAGLLIVGVIIYVYIKHDNSVLWLIAVAFALGIFGSKYFKKQGSILGESKPIYDTFGNIGMTLIMIFFLALLWFVGSIANGIQ